MSMVEKKSGSCSILGSRWHAVPSSFFTRGISTVDSSNHGNHCVIQSTIPSYHITNHTMHFCKEKGCLFVHANVQNGKVIKTVKIKT